VGRPILFENLAIQPYKVNSFDPFHAELIGTCKKVFSYIISLLKRATPTSPYDALDDLNTRLSKLMLPPLWKKLPSIVLSYERESKKAQLKYTGSQHSRFAQIAPFLFHSWLSNDKLKSNRNNVISELEARIGKRHICLSLINLIHALALSNKTIFRNHQGTSQAEKKMFEENIFNMRHQMCKVMGSDACSTWNFHLAQHWPKQQYDFGVAYY